MGGSQPAGAKLAALGGSQRGPPKGVLFMVVLSVMFAFWCMCQIRSALDIRHDMISPHTGAGGGGCFLMSST